MEGKEIKREPHVLNQGDVRERLRKKYPQLTVQGRPFFSRFELKRMDDEEFRFLCEKQGEILVSNRSLNYINERCKQLGIMKENFEGGLRIKPT